jgi:hypothetical protein
MLKLPSAGCRADRQVLPVHAFVGGEESGLEKIRLIGHQPEAQSDAPRSSVSARSQSDISSPAP